MVTLTERAAHEIQGLLEKQDKLDHGLRIWVQGGGCSGYQYGMALDNETDDNDSTFESNGVKVFVDGMSLKLIDGSSIDFVETLMGGGFKVENPNAVGNCGCGHSFQTEETAGESGGCGSCSSARY